MESPKRDQYMSIQPVARHNSRKTRQGDREGGGQAEPGVSHRGIVDHVVDSPWIFLKSSNPLSKQIQDHHCVTLQPDPSQCSSMATDEDDDYGDELVYDSELDETLRNAETEVPDIEDAVQPQALAPFDEFRQRGFLSVSDLVATVWCEVQFD